MKEFPTCRFLSTALSQSDEDSAPADLREQNEGQQFVTIEDSGLFIGAKVRRNRSSNSLIYVKKEYRIEKGL